ncbi:MAG: nitrite reductase small subunit NirD [Desulfuromonadales bacterium]|nr:nitrite reductase small subunit NirD [Desulfuromonadales bacterium]NIS40853.1 nitrite reductase small subunit NirD [Desulfuromonadales bacterium]
MSDWITIGKVEDIPKLGSRVVTTDDGDIAVFRTSDDHIFALRDHCPHQGGPLSQGMVYGHTVACPLHNWSIDLKSGEAVAPDKGCSHSYPVQVENGVIAIAAPVSNVAAL